jgi:hypothetical protein
MKQEANFVGWDFAGTWLSQAGLVDPLLRAFMAPLTVKANDATMTYNGLAYDGAGGVSYTIPPNASLLGTVTFGSAAHNPLDAGSYTLTPGGLYSAQQGYIISYANGTLTVNRAIVSLSGERAHDATTRFAASIFGSNGVISTGVGTETLNLSGAGNVASANAGVQPLNLGTLALADGSGLASNYTFTGGTHTGRITGSSGNVAPPDSGDRLGSAIMSGASLLRFQNAVAKEVSLSPYQTSDGENGETDEAASALGKAAELRLTVVGTGIKPPLAVYSDNGNNTGIK